LDRTAASYLSPHEKTQLRSRAIDAIKEFLPKAIGVVCYLKNFDVFSQLERLSVQGGTMLA
jgi:hypothetical protein